MPVLWTGAKAEPVSADGFSRDTQKIFKKNIREVFMTLREAKPGFKVSVKKLSGQGPVKRRIMDMGITKNVEIYIRKVAPLGDPVEVTVRGYELSLRKADAEMVEVQ